MKNPDKYIRKAYGILLSGVFSGSTTIPIYDRRVPINIDPIPNIRIVISSQTKNTAKRSKCGHEWDCTIALDVICEFRKGTANSAIVDDIEEQISDLIDIYQATGGFISIPPFTVYDTKLDSVNDIEIETPTHTIIRKILRYRHLINGVL